MPRSKLNDEAKNALDAIIKKSRVHFYKPIQVAEVLNHHRLKKGLNLEDLESYRSSSKRWRDDVTALLVGRRSTSSAKYQDNVFDENAMPPRLLTRLGELNKKYKGAVEAYIYKALLMRFSVVHEVEKYIKSSDPETFDLKKLEALFIQNPGLKRSVDKMYEVSVYALFSTLVRALKAQVTIEVLNRDAEILSDFAVFIKAVLGITPQAPKLVLPAAVYRVGVTNAADRGLDILANFGAAIQVKHLTLTPETLEDIVDNIMSDRIVVVCRDAEKKPIEALLSQVGWKERIQGIVTLQDLSDWYKACLRQKYRNTLGLTLLSDLIREFNAEFPSGDEIGPFIRKRGYPIIEMPAGWETATSE